MLIGLDMPIARFWSGIAHANSLITLNPTIYYLNFYYSNSDPFNKSEPDHLIPYVIKN